MGRTSDSRSRILASATRLFGQRSYASIGVAEIAADAGVPKGSFYHFFRSKQGLALAVIDAHWQQQSGAWRSILAQSAPLQVRLGELVAYMADVQKETATGTGSAAGCLFGNLSIEAGDAESDAVTARLREIFDAQVDMIEEAIRTASDLSPSRRADARARAKAIVTQLEGALLFAKLFNDPRQLDRLWTDSMLLLGAEERVTTGA